MFSLDGNASQFYRSLSPHQQEELRDALDYIRDVPFEHGDTIVKRVVDSEFIYLYEDDLWRISFKTILQNPSNARSFTISILAITSSPAN